MTMEIISEKGVIETPVQTFFSNENVLITGGTGFLGKMLIEKLLRTCKNINTIYLLIRAKKGKNMHTRVEELFDDPVFEKLREENPKFRHQIQGITGDCSLPGLGLNLSDRKLLISEVSIVFHAAATVKFDEKLRLAVAINVQGPKDLFELSKEMQKLKAVVHVSTAYANCTHKFIEEKFYPTPTDTTKLSSIIDSSDDKLLDNITPAILCDWPNTYTYTKAVAEDLIRREYTDLPIGVFRPAIVVSTYKEPIRGWIDNMYGPTGICAGAGTGVLRSLPCEPNSNANIVPGDMCVNAMICSAWQIHKKDQEIKQQQKAKTEQDIPIYNYVSCVDKPITWDIFMDLASKNGICYPSTRAIWYYSFSLNRYYPVHLFYVLILQLLPALLVDTILLCFGKPPQLLKMYKKIMKFTNIIQYFTVRNWDFSNDSVRHLWEALEKEDQNLFEFDLRSLEWEDYFKTYVKGIRTYLLKEPLKTLPEARKRWKRLYWLHQVTKFVLVVLALKILWSLISLLF